jgi:hypothetical protein
MPSLTSCLKLAAPHLRPEAIAAITTRVGALREEGLSAVEAGRKAVQEQLAGTETKLTEVTKAIDEGRELFAEPVAPDPAAAATVAQREVRETAGDVEMIAPDRLAQIEREFPDMLVELDDMPPMPARELLQKIDAEVAEELADAPLYKAAAECFLMHGMDA